MIKKVTSFLKQEILFITFFLLMVILISLYPEHLKNLKNYIDWETIVTLSGLLIITTAIKLSRALDNLSSNIINILKTERTLSLGLVLLSVAISPLFTNDIALFIIIPLTISIKDAIKNDMYKVIIFETIGVNIGSLLTPIGNPQNIFLWHRWNISFIRFSLEMLPLFLVSLLVLLIFVIIFTPPKILSKKEKKRKKEKTNKVLFIFSTILFISFIIAVELDLTYYAFFIIAILYLLFFREAICKADWMLIALFIVIFIDFRIISSIPVISNYINSLNLKTARNVFLISLTISQLISNVPATIFISKFSNLWKAIAYGVNIGGAGLFIGSFANIITLRMVGDKKLFFNFHKYSIPFLFIITIISIILFFK